MPSYPTLVDAVRGCKACPLGSRGRGVPGAYFDNGERWDPEAVPGFSPEVMFILEAPGAVEQQAGWPVQGDSGQLLHSMLGECGVEFYYVTNIAKHRPFKDRNGKQTEPDAVAIKACAPFLVAEIRLVQPQKLILVGKTAAKLAHPGNQSMKALVGSTAPYNGIPTLVLYHTAHFLYNRTAPWINKQVREWKQSIRLFLGERPEKYEMEKVRCGTHENQV